jgi:hypothetical protein
MISITGDRTFSAGDPEHFVTPPPRAAPLNAVAGIHAAD